MFVFVGCYTEPPHGHGEGISVYRFDPETGALSHVDHVGARNPSFLAVHPSGRVLFAVNELERGEVSAFDLDPRAGQLIPINRQPTHGSAPCYVSVDAAGRFALVANYTSGTVAVLPIARVGRLDPASCVVEHKGSSVNPSRQGEPHAHMITPTPDGRFVLATDLGTDEIVIYRLAAETGRLERHGAAKANPGAGPRHVAFAPNGRVLYAINELDSTVTVYDYDGERGELTPRQTVAALPEGYSGESWCAHIAVSPDGRFVYGSNRGHDSIAIFAVDEATGELRPAGHEPTGGRVPRHFALDPTGTWLLVANQRSDSIVTFRRDAETGRLVANGATITPTPVALAFGPEAG